MIVFRRSEMKRSLRSEQQPPDRCLIVSPPSEPYNIIINTTAEEHAPCLVLWLLYSYSPLCSGSLNGSARDYETLLLKGSAEVDGWCLFVGDMISIVVVASDSYVGIKCLKSGTEMEW